MKMILLFVMLVLGAVFSDTVRGKSALYCGQIKNSYGVGDTAISTQSKTNAPWKFKVDTVFIDTDGSGHYKKLGTGVADAGDTSKAIPLRQIAGTMAPLGYVGMAGYRQSSNDSGSFAIKAICWSALSKSWITSKNLQFDPYNSGSDTLVTVPADSGAFGVERYIPSYCDSVKFVLTVKNVTSRSSNAAKQTSLFRMGVCAY